MGLLVTPTCFFNCAPVSGGGELIGALDSYTQAKYAWSLRRCWSSYTGPLIRVRDNTTTTEQDFTNASGSAMVDVAAIESFLSGHDGHIVTFYNQGTRGSDGDLITNSSNAYKKIATAGTVNLTSTSGNPYFSSSLYSPLPRSGLGSAEYDDLCQSSLTYAVSFWNNTTNNGYRFGCGNTLAGTTGMWIHVSTSSNRLYCYTLNGASWLATGSAVGSVAGIAGRAAIWTYGTNITLHENGSKIGTISATGTTSETAWRDDSFLRNGISGKVAEALIWDSAMSETDINAITADQSTVWED